MQIFDITLMISPAMPVWPGDPLVELERIESMDAGAHVNVSRLACSVHTGTHVDAPHHFLNDDRTVEALPLEILIGTAQVLHIPNDVNLVSADVLEQAGVLAGTVRLLLRTRNSEYWKRVDMQFHEDFVAISADGAEWLARHGIRLIGVDYLSVSPFQQSDLPHQILLHPGIIILEGLDLSAVPPGQYELCCLPLKLAGSDGAPARAVLLK